MNPYTFLPRADRCAASGGPPSGILGGALSPPPLLPPLPAVAAAAANEDQQSVNAVRDLSLGGGVSRHILLYNSANRPTHQFFFVGLIFQSRSYKFSTLNFPLPKKCFLVRLAFITVVQNFSCLTKKRGRKNDPVYNWPCTISPKIPRFLKRGI